MLTQNEIMKQILTVRHESPEQERELCFTLLSQCEDHYEEAFARTYLADALSSMGLLDSAVQECKKALDITLRNNYEELSLTLYNLIGIIYTYTDDEQGALDYYFKGIKLATRMNDNMMCGALFANIAFLYRKFQAYDKAIETLRMAYDIVQKASENKMRVAFNDYVYSRELAGIELQRGQTDRAMEILQQIDNLEEHLDDTELLIMYAAYYQQKQNKEESLKYLKIVLEQIEKDDNQFQRISYYFDIIETLLLLKEYEEAEKIAQKAEVVLRGMNIPGKWVMLAEYEIQIYEKLGDSQKAGRAYEMYYKKDVQQSENRKQTEVKRLKKRIELQKEINKRADIEARKIMLVSQSEQDELTKIYNRRGIKRHVGAKFKETQQLQKSFSIAIVDVDYFKEYNDTYGHPAGDNILQTIAQILEESVSKAGIVGRYGGDEFLIAIAQRNSEEVEQIICCIREKLKQKAIKNRRSTVSEYVTVSIGAVNVVPERKTLLSEYIHAADHALYEIKKTSKNGFLVLSSF